jgi:serine-type D-Ala-D-Ala carboxypeptidase (penicillin-binding protein 5/6)
MFTHAPRLLRNPHFHFLLLLLTIWLGLFCWTGPVSAQFHFKDYNARPKLASPDSILARAVQLVDAQTGQVLYARNPDERLLPASTTKLMTALIVYEKLGGFKGSVTIQESDRAEPSNIPVVPGETISVNTLFHALLIESCNDSARALGRYVAGSNEAFVGMMNQRAIALGCFNTHFNNPNGLPAPNGTHFTSCADLMKIFRQVLKYPDLVTILSTKEYTIRTASGVHNLRNHNRLLGYYPGMGAAKTGWTVAARHTYACAVTQGKHTLLLTLLNSPNKWQDAQILFNWGFAQVRAQPGAGAGAPLESSLPPAPSGLAEPDSDR